MYQCLLHDRHPAKIALNIEDNKSFSFLSVYSAILSGELNRRTSVQRIRRRKDTYLHRSACTAAEAECPGENLRLLLLDACKRGIQLPELYIAVPPLAGDQDTTQGLKSTRLTFLGT